MILGIIILISIYIILVMIFAEGHEPKELNQEKRWSDKDMINFAQRLSAHEVTKHELTEFDKYFNED